MGRPPSGSRRLSRLIEPFSRAGRPGRSSISSGDQKDTCGVRHGHAYCWGYNNRGQGGNGTTGTSHVPTRVGATLDPWAEIGAGDSHSCELRTNHTIYCWGENPDGELGTGNVTDYDKPRGEALKNADWSALSVGYYYACALRSNHALYCWGYNSDGELGAGDINIRNKPTHVL